MINEEIRRKQIDIFAVDIMKDYEKKGNPITFEEAKKMAQMKLGTKEINTMNKELIINDLLQEIISHSSRCAHCKYLRQENDNCYCFFAYACLTQDFYYWDEEE